MTSSFSHECASQWYKIVEGGRWFCRNQRSRKNRVLQEAEVVVERQGNWESHCKLGTLAGMQNDGLAKPSVSASWTNFSRIYTAAATSSGSSLVALGRSIWMWNMELDSESRSRTSVIMPRQCKNHPDIFCYVCGSFAIKTQRRKITNDLRNIYELYFGCHLGDQDKVWAPHTICSACSNGLRDWLNKRKSSMPFAIPMVWREQKNHYNDCYFCNVNVNGFSKKNKHNINYPNLDSAIRPVIHSASLPIPIPPEEEDADYTPDEDKSSLQTFSQDELNDLIRDMSLSKEKAELLASRLKQKNLLQKNVRVCHYRNRNRDLISYFKVDGPLCYAHDIDGLFKALSQDYIISDWRLFIDSSQRSLKAVLLHNGNLKPCIPIAHSVHLKESYDNMKILLDAIKYNTYKWQICGDLKVIGMLMGMQGGFTKYCCFLCIVQSIPLVDPNNIFLPPLHIKLGLIKNFVKAMGKTNSEGFQYLKEKFSKVSAAKLKEGILIGPQIRELIKDNNFVRCLNTAEQEAWQAFIWTCENFLGNHKALTYKDNTMSNIDKTVHSEENIINDPAPAPAVANPVTECEMDALLLGRIGISIFLDSWPVCCIFACTKAGVFVDKEPLTYVFQQ
ncbi:hypothetical protein QTP88_008441 [Uroleucon formosanum]